jgi:hypothetical protein
MAKSLSSGFDGTRTGNNHDLLGQDSTPQALIAGACFRAFQCWPGLRADGLLPSAVLRDPAQLPDLRRRGLMDRLPGAKGPHPDPDPGAGRDRGCRA